MLRMPAIEMAGRAGGGVDHRIQDEGAVKIVIDMEG